MTLLKSWQRLCYNLAKEPKVCTAGTRKILRDVRWDTPFDNSITLTHTGYQAKLGLKISQLNHHYRNQKSIDRAVEDFTARIDKRTYGSVGVSMHGEQKKGYTKQGFCIQALTLTLVPQARGILTTEVDVFYRTTEVVKKFGADLVFLRDEILPEFQLNNAPLAVVKFHFANLSVHPMFFTLLAITDKHWEKHIRKIKKYDLSFYGSIMRWSKRCLTGKDREKFAQAMRVTRGLEDNLSASRIQELIKFTDQEISK